MDTLPMPAQGHVMWAIIGGEDYNHKRIGRKVSVNYDIPNRRNGQHTEGGLVSKDELF